MRILLERVLAVMVILVVIGVPVTVFGFGPAILGVYDNDHWIRITCQVKSAESDIASSRSTKGIGSSQAQVTFHTDCGNLILLDGVDRSNRGAIAAKIEGNRKYQFEVGGGSYQIRGLLKIVKVAPTIYSYHQI